MRHADEMMPPPRNSHNHQFFLQIQNKTQRGFELRELRSLGGVHHRRGRANSQIVLSGWRFRSRPANRKSKSGFGMRREGWAHARRDNLERLFDGQRRRSENSRAAAARAGLGRGISG